MSVPTRPAVAAGPTPPSSQAIGQVVAAGQQLQALLESAVRVARLSGATWLEIGRALGVTRQAASKRWGYLEQIEHTAVHLVVDRATGRASYVIQQTGEHLPRDLEHPRHLIAAKHRLREIAAGHGGQVRGVVDGQVVLDVEQAAARPRESPQGDLG